MAWAATRSFQIVAICWDATSGRRLQQKIDAIDQVGRELVKLDRPIILYCAGGGRAALAGKTLRDMGFSDVRNLGGFRDWMAAGGAIEPG